MAAREQDQMSFDRHFDRHHDGRLDATAGREVVYCHACSHEWYRDEQGVQCPECNSDVVEIIDPNNDPRDADDNSSASTSPEISPFQREDSDPEEADIADHLGPQLRYRRDVRNRPGQQHHDPGVNPVLEQFLSVIQSLSPPTRTTQANMFPPDDTAPVRFGPRIQRTTFMSSPFGGGTTQVTIVSGPIPRGAPGSGGDPFQAIFSNVVRDMGPPGGDDDHEIPGPPGFARSLHDILNLISPGNVMPGDAVDTQEALDRIITNLMDANPQNNAAPPASEEGIQKLDRKTVDKDMLGEDKTECSICIDSLKEGETAAFLPCKHYFHDECVVLWLKAHNTCPICRAPIEKYTPASASEGNPPGIRPPFSNPFGPLAEPSGAEPPQPWPGMPGGGPRSGLGEAGRPSRPWRYTSRPPSQGQSRLNEVFRNISSQPRQEHGPEREQDRDSEQASTSGFDTSRLQRRSHSPTSPRNGGDGIRMRQRSPSQNSRRSDRERRQSGSGPMSWFRRFSSNGSSRDSRRH